MSNIHNLELPVTPLAVAGAVADKWRESSAAVQGSGKEATLSLISELGAITIAPDHGDATVDDGHVALVLGSGRRANRIALFQHNGNATVQLETGETLLPDVDQPGLNFLYQVIRSGQPQVDKRRRGLFGLGRGPQG